MVCDKCIGTGFKKVTCGQGEGTEDSHQARVEFTLESRERCGKVAAVNRAGEGGLKSLLVLTEVPHAGTQGCTPVFTFCLQGTAKEPSTCFLRD